MLADGKPLTSGRIVFLVDRRRPRLAAADIGSDGAFEFKGPSGDGLPAAKYRVHIAPVCARWKQAGRQASVRFQIPR